MPSLVPGMMSQAPPRTGMRPEDEGMLSRLGALPPLEALRRPEVPDFVRQQFMERLPRSSDPYAAVLDDALKPRDFNVPINVQALAGFDPQVASALIGGQAAVQQQGTSPEERLLRMKIGGATRIGEAGLMSDAHTNRSVADQNVGMRQALAGLLGDIHGGMVARDASAAEIAQGAQRMDHERGMMKDRQKFDLDLEGKRYERDQGERSKAAFLANLNSDFQVASQALQSNTQAAISRIDSDVQNDLRDPDEAAVEKQALQDNFIKQRNTLMQNLQQKRSALSAKGTDPGAIAMPDMPKVSDVDRSFEMRPYKATLERLYTENAKEGPFDSSIQNFLGSLPDEFHADPRLKTLLHNFIRKRMPSDDITSARDEGGILPDGFWSNVVGTGDRSRTQALLQGFK